MKQLNQKMGRRISLAMTALLAAGSLVMSGAAGADLTGTVTSVTGDASVGENPAEISALVGSGESIMTGPGASCSVLIDKRSLVQFCGQAAVRLRHVFHYFQVMLFGNLHDSVDLCRHTAHVNRYDSLGMVSIGKIGTIMHIASSKGQNIFFNMGHFDTEPWGKLTL